MFGRKLIESGKFVDTPVGKDCEIDKFPCVLFGAGLFGGSLGAGGRLLVRRVNRTKTCASLDNGAPSLRLYTHDVNGDQTGDVQIPASRGRRSKRRGFRFDLSFAVVAHLVFEVLPRLEWRKEINPRMPILGYREGTKCTGKKDRENTAGDSAMRSAKLRIFLNAYSYFVFVEPLRALLLLSLRSKKSAVARYPASQLR